MSKIGRRPISIGDAAVDIKGQEIHYKGKHGAGMHLLSDLLTAKLVDKELFIAMADKTSSRSVFSVWGLHRALIANKISGVNKLFEKQVLIIGLGFKAIPKGKNIEFSLGYSHKINFALPDGVTLEVDKTGQQLMLRSHDKELVGKVCGDICFLRKIEPYKGTGIRLSTDVVIRKAGKAKAGSA